MRKRGSSAEAENPPRRDGGGGGGGEEDRRRPPPSSPTSRSPSKKRPSNVVVAPLAPLPPSLPPPPSSSSCVAGVTTTKAVVSPPQCREETIPPSSSSSLVLRPFDPPPCPAAPLRPRPPAVVRAPSPTAYVPAAAVEGPPRDLASSTATTTNPGKRGAAGRVVVERFSPPTTPGGGGCFGASRGHGYCNPHHRTAADDDYRHRRPPAFLPATTTTATTAAAAAAAALPASSPRAGPPGATGGAVVASSSSSANPNPPPPPSSSSSARSSSVDDRTSRDYYFDSYAHHGIHEEMLKDEVRTRTYQMAIRNNGHLFQGKVVLDVGCGTGILSMFAAQAGAKHVYGVDCSSIVDQAAKIVEINGFGDRITLIKGKVEEIDLPVPRVDIIVSEWMGYFLLYESMLDTVLYARDKWLIPGGIVFPDKAVLYVCAVEDAQVKRERIDFWEDVYGFDMTPIKKIAMGEPVVDVVDAKAVVTDAVPILRIDILTCAKSDLSFSSDFLLRAHRNDVVHGLVAYFECAFTQIDDPIGFSTAPFAQYTHWKQTIFYLNETLTDVEEGEEIMGRISCRPNGKNERDLDIAIHVKFDGKRCRSDETTEYRLR